MRTFFRYTLATFMSIAATVAWCGEEPAVQEKPALYASQTMTMSMLVAAVNQETREVTLRDSDGGEHTFTAGEHVRNLAQLKAGDVVNAQYTEDLSIEVYDNPGLVPGAGELTALGRAELGAKPGVSAFDTQVLTATVEAIDIEANTFQLKWPDDSITEFTARNPENLKKAAVGDLVVITKTISLDISVEDSAAE